MLLLQVILGDLFPQINALLCSIQGARTTESPLCVHGSQTRDYCGGLANQHVLLVAVSSTASSRKSQFKKKKKKKFSVVAKRKYEPDVNPESADSQKQQLLWRQFSQKWIKTISALKLKNLAIRTLLVSVTGDEGTGMLGALQRLQADVSAPTLRTPCVVRVHATSDRVMPEGEHLLSDCCIQLSVPTSLSSGPGAASGLCHLGVPQLLKVTLIQSKGKRTSWYNYYALH